MQRTLELYKGDNPINAVMARRPLYWLPALLYMGLIFMLSSQSQLPVPWNFPESDKVVHVLLYFPLGFLLAYALSRSAPGAKNLMFLAAFLAFLYGMTDEIHQHFVPGRNASALDLMANSMGALFGSSTFVWMRRNGSKGAPTP